MQYFFLKKVDQILSLNFNLNDINYLSFVNNILNIKFNIFLSHYNFILFKKLNNFYIFFKFFKDKSKFINNVRKSFLSVLRGFCLHLDLIGLGFSVVIKKSLNILRLNIGYNHSIFYKIPSYVLIKTKRKRIFLFSYSFFFLKSVFVVIKNFRNLSVYKLKGIKVKNELYVKKN